MNHWQLAVETHNTNFPDVLHDCVNISACDPRRYPRTTMLITSPEGKSFLTDPSQESEKKLYGK